MAFATTVQSCENRGSVTEVRGTWTGAAGDAAGTLAVAGIALTAEFLQNLAAGPYQPGVPVSGIGTATVTVYNNSTVTGGTFRVAYK